jgi:plasmid stabilization system protein ParE
MPPGFETTVAFDLLAKAPSLGHLREDLTSLPVRFWPVGDYLVIYRVQAKAIEIVAVTQGSRDLPTFRQRGT